MSGPFSVHPASTPLPCCVPSKHRAERLAESRYFAERRPKASLGSTEGMVKLDSTRFLMGTETEDGFPADGEGPVRDARWVLDRCPSGDECKVS